MNRSKLKPLEPQPIDHLVPLSAEPVVSVRGLRMAYGYIEAVRGIDLEVHRGEVFAFLGPNGAGKTTTVEILEGFRRRTVGKVQVLREDPGVAGGAWRARLGVVLQESEPEAELRVRECLALYTGYYPAPRPVAETLELVGLQDQAGALCRTLSGGQRQRLDVALALIGDPELLFLDEPTTGFDPSARRAAWEVIAGLRALGKTIFLTTHFMDEAEVLADRIAVIAQGRIVAEGTAASLGVRDTTETVIGFSLPPDVTPADLPLPQTVAAAPDAQGRIELRSSRPVPLLAALTGWAVEQGFDLPDLQVTRPMLRLLAHEFYYDTLVFVRNRQSMFFTLGLPVIFLVLFASIFGSNTVRVAGRPIHVSAYYVPNLIALGIIAASFVNLVASVTAAREAGIYKRRRATPVPAGIIIGGRSLTAVVTALLSTGVLMAIGRVAYGATIPVQALPALLADVIVGTLAFCALGYALAGLIRDADAVQPVTQAIVLPLYLISGVFISASLIPDWLTRLANFFPVRHLAQALLTAYNPYAGGSGVAWHDLGSVALWGAAGLYVAIRRLPVHAPGPAEWPRHVDNALCRMLQSSC